MSESSKYGHFVTGDLGLGTLEPQLHPESELPIAEVKWSIVPEGERPRDCGFVDAKKTVRLK